MKKITITLMAILFAICLNGFAQTTVDIGYDWSNTTYTSVLAGSGTNFPTSGTEAIVNSLVPPELRVSWGGAAAINASDGKGVYINNSGTQANVRYVKISADQTDYVELSLTANSASNNITNIKINGTSDKTSGSTDVAAPAVLFSDKAPFDVNSVIGAVTLSSNFPYCRLGGTSGGSYVAEYAGYSLTPPEGCKSYRIYRKARLSSATPTLAVPAQIVGTGGTIFGTSAGSTPSLKIAYLSATLTATTPTVPTLVKTSGNNTPTVYENKAITDIKYTFGGTATKATVTWTDAESNPINMPTGIDTATVNKVLTISGTPTTIGVYNYTVTTDGTPAATETGTITVVVAPTSSIVDIGYDWDGSAEVLPVSGTYITSGMTTPALVSSGTENEVSVSWSGATVESFAGSLYDGSSEYAFYKMSSDFAQYVEVSLTENSTHNNITEIKINGTSDQTSGTKDAIPAILFSDEIPFNPNKVIGYTVVDPKLAYCRTGNTGFTFTAPANCKSYRVYRRAMLKNASAPYEAVASGGTAYGGGSGVARIGYLSATLEAVAPSLLLTSGSNTPSVAVNTAITNIKYTFGGTATKATVTWKDAGDNNISIPAGIDTVTVGKTLTISGMPTTVGVYNYTITTDGTPVAAKTGTITVLLPTNIDFVSTNKTIVSVKYYTLTGLEVNKNTLGILVVKTIYKDGSIIIEKIFNTNL